MPMELIITRSGKFNATQMNNTPFKCGAMKNKRYEYSVTIECFDTKLTPEGFIVNNELLQAYFEFTFGERAPRKWDAISCENMARKAARDLCGKLLSESVAVICVTVSIKGSNGAWLTAKKKPDDGTELGGSQYKTQEPWGFD